METIETRIRNLQARLEATRTLKPGSQTAGALMTPRLISLTPFLTHSEPVLEQMRGTVEWWAQRAASGAPTGCLLTLWGRNGKGNGTGKTFLARLAVDELKRKGVKGVRFIYWPDLIGRGQRREDTAKDQRTAERCNVLIIDDAGAEHRTGASDTKLSNLLEMRMRKFTLMTTNISPAEWGDIEHRIKSRIIREENRHVCCETIDYALRKFKK